MVLKDEQLMAIQHIYNDKDMFVRLLGYGNIMVSPFVFVLRIHFEKTEATYRRHRLGHRTTVVHGVAACCSHIFQIFLHVTISGGMKMLVPHWLPKVQSPPTQW